MALGACCPQCGSLATHVHSHYVRTLADLPCASLAVRLHLGVRKFFCANPLCCRHIFTEPLPGLAARYARRTLRLHEVWQLLGFVVGGEAGSRLARDLSMATSGDTLLRIVRRWHPDTPKDLDSVSAVGVDDWAMRRGCTYGTLLMDLEQRRVLELLPDREASSVQKWLSQHPGVQIVSRDRGGPYAEAARLGAPTATQVADRWHLLKNLGDAMERLLSRHTPALRDITNQLVQERALETMSPKTEAADHLENPAAQTSLPVLTLAGEHHRQRFEEIHALRQQGLGLRAISKRLGLARNTVRRYAYQSEFVPTHRTPQHNSLTPFLPYLEQACRSGYFNATDLWRQIHAQGYSGSVSTVREHLQSYRLQPRRRKKPSQEKGEPKRAVTTAYRIPSPRSTTWWLLKSENKLTAEQSEFVQRLCGAYPCLKTARDLAQRFGQLVRERREPDLNAWMAAVQESELPELRGFAQGLLQDEAAVRAGLSLPWSNGPVEGKINKLKFIKRQMYGRANFDLLRLRVLYAT